MSRRQTPSGQGRSSGAFTLVELLVVIGIIALLIAILMPALRRAKESANAVQCSSNQRQLMMAFLMFANDHKGRLPGNYWDAQAQQPDDPDKRDWLIGDNPNQGNALAQLADAPQKGTIFRYVNNAAVYRCPSVVADGSSDGFDTAARLRQVLLALYPAHASDGKDWFRVRFSVGQFRAARVADAAEPDPF